MNLTKIKPIALIGIGAIVILLLILGIVIFSGKKPTQPAQISQPPATVKPVPLLQPSGFANELAKLTKILPYKGTNYSIEYLKPVNIISVKIDAQSQEEFVRIKNEAEQYIKDQGVENICSLNIFWVSNNVKVDANLLITTDCPSIQKR